VVKTQLRWALVLIPFLAGCQAPGVSVDFPSLEAPPPGEPPVVEEPRGSGVLLYGGAGAWSTEVSALQALLAARGVSYRKVTSAELDTLTLEELASYALILWPGGTGGTQVGSLGGDARIRLRQAVQEKGVSWLGFCAGAFVAVGPKPPAQSYPSYGLGILEGSYLDYYYLEGQGVDAAMTRESFADGSSRELLWYGGPVVPEVPGGVVARYPNGDAAISQARSGQGFVVLSAVHPAAPPSVASSFGLTDGDGADTELAWQLIRAALERAPLPAFP
jgi:glutamine amidotransferase-like uncharacterized protein